MKRTLQLALALALASSTALHAGAGLIRAATKGDLGKVKELVASGENLNDTDKYGWTALMWAAYYQYEPVLSYLLDNGADPNVQSTVATGSIQKGATALIIASYYGRAELVGPLVQKKAKVEIADASGNTAVDYARQYNFTEVLDILAKTPGTAGGAKVYLPKGVDGTPLGKNYTTVLLTSYTTLPQLATDYPGATRECETGTLATLQELKAFEKSGMAGSVKSYNASTLLVKVEITDLRIASNAARYWGGAWAGASYVHARVTLVDGASGKVLREQLLTTENNPWGAAWTGGATDMSIPRDMGVIIARYIMAVVAK
jgi:hypothetical protein